MPDAGVATSMTEVVAPLPVFRPEWFNNMLFPTILIGGFPTKVLLPFTVAPVMLTPENRNSKPLNADAVKLWLPGPACPIKYPRRSR
jgi:hypothetical protein